MKKDTSSNNVMLTVEGLKKYFPVRRGFFQGVVGWIKAVDGVDLTIHHDDTGIFQGKRHRICPSQRHGLHAGG